MANTRSAQKRIRSSQKRMMRNAAIRTRARSFVQKARQLIAQGDWTRAEKAVAEATIALDRAVSKGVLPRNNAARRKARLWHSLRKAQS